VTSVSGEGSGEGGQVVCETFTAKNGGQGGRHIQLPQIGGVGRIMWVVWGFVAVAMAVGRLLW
jgi:hypothetical protein